MMVHHLSSTFGRLERAETGPSRNDRGNKSQDAPKSSESVRRERNQRADGSNHRNRTHLHRPLCVHQDQGFGIRHPLNDVIHLVAPGNNGKLRTTGGEDEDNCGILRESTAPRKNRQ
jgi:hypothetical protein